MRIRLLATAAILGASLTGAANAQTWTRQELNAEAWGQNEDSTLMFGCVRGIMAASLMVTLPLDSRFRSLRSGSTYEVTFEVDGILKPVRMDYEPSESANFIRQINADQESGWAEEDTLNDLVYSLQDGSQLTVRLGETTLTTMSLAGSSDALRGIYIGCGMRMSGTGVMD